MKNAIYKLKINIPSLHEASTDLEVLEITAKYIEFMRKFVDIEHDKQFLESQILWKKKSSACNFIPTSRFKIVSLNPHLTLKKNQFVNKIRMI